MAAFDADRDGISYSEYILLLTFLKFPAQVNCYGSLVVFLPIMRDLNIAFGLQILTRASEFLISAA